MNSSQMRGHIVELCREHHVTTVPSSAGSLDDDARRRQLVVPCHHLTTDEYFFALYGLAQMVLDDHPSNEVDRLSSIIQRWAWALRHAAMAVDDDVRHEIFFDVDEQLPLFFVEIERMRNADLQASREGQAPAAAPEEST